MHAAVKQRLEFLSVLRGKNYLKYWIGLVTSVTSHQALITAQGWLVYDITGEELALGLVAAAQAIPAIAFNLFGGALADRYDPRKLITIGSGSAFLVILLLAILVITELVQIWHIVASAFFIGIATSLDQPSRRVIWPALIRRDQFIYATALNQGVWNGTRIFAPMIAAAPIAIVGSITGNYQAGAAIAFFLIAVGFATMAIIIQTIKLPDLKRATGETVLHDIVDGLRFVMSHKIFLILLGMSFAIGYFGLSYQWLLPAFVVDVLKLGPENLGLLYTVNGAGGLVGIFIAASYGQQYSKAKMIGTGSTILGLSVFVFGINGIMAWYWFALVSAAISGCIYSIFQTAANTLLNLLVPTEYRGRVMGLRGVMWSLAPLGALQAGLLASLTNVSIAISTGGAIVIVMTILIFLFSKQMRSINDLLDQADLREKNYN
ncbi:MAG: MFS transporter [SAR202 cluster bacterium]|nr:MFS transporter [SAR202 cluster bacterium]